MKVCVQTGEIADWWVWALALLSWEVLGDSAFWSPAGNCLFTALRSCRLRTGMTKRWLTPLIGSSHLHPNGSKLGSVESGAVTQTPGRQTHPQRWNVKNPLWVSVFLQRRGRPSTAHSLCFFWRGKKGKRATSFNALAIFSPCVPPQLKSKPRDFVPAPRLQLLF